MADASPADDELVCQFCSWKDLDKEIVGTTLVKGTLVVHQLVIHKKIIIANKTRDSWYRNSTINTWTFVCWIAICFNCSSKCPNMFTRGLTMSETNSIDISFIDCILRSPTIEKCYWYFILVCNNFSKHDCSSFHGINEDINN